MQSQFDKDLELYKDVTTGERTRLSLEDCEKLGQPPYPGFMLFKMFVYLLRRIEALEKKR
jgi:hypothetical protein